MKNEARTNYGTNTKCMARLMTVTEAAQELYGLIPLDIFAIEMKLRLA